MKYFQLFGKMTYMRLIRPYQLRHISWSELLVYGLRQAFHLTRKTFTQYLDSYRLPAEEEQAIITSPYGPLWVPASLPFGDLKMLFRESLDRKHWHQYDTKETPIEASDIVVDCGTADGLWALSVVNRCKKMVLIEPQPEFVMCLKKTFSSYIAEGKVEIHNVAVGEEDGCCSISTGASLAKSVQASTNGIIPLRRLDALLPDKEVSFLKADIEGAELQMLKGGRELILRCKPKIAVTVYHSKNNWQEIRDYLVSLVPEYRYRLKGMVAWGKPLMLHMWVERLR